MHLYSPYWRKEQAPTASTCSGLRVASLLFLSLHMSRAGSEAWIVTVDSQTLASKNIVFVGSELAVHYRYSHCRWFSFPERTYHWNDTNLRNPPPKSEPVKENTRSQSPWNWPSKLRMECPRWSEEPSDDSKREGQHPTQTLSDMHFWVYPSDFFAYFGVILSISWFTDLRYTEEWYTSWLLFRQNFLSVLCTCHYYYNQLVWWDHVCAGFLTIATLAVTIFGLVGTPMKT